MRLPASPESANTGDREGLRGSEWLGRAWAPEDRVFKLADARKLAGMIPGARLETIDDARTFVALDQPQRLAELIGNFVAETESAPAASA